MSSIEWTDATWNPVRGCSLVSAGCTHCYAMWQANRFSGPGGPYEGLTRLGPNGPVWTGEVRLVPELLDAPLHWRRPRRVFVNSMSDLFHEGLADHEIDRIFAVMALAKRHTFQVLTKRLERMRQYFMPIGGTSRGGWVVSAMGRRLNANSFPFPKWPLPNVWLGASCEDQRAFDTRVENLKRIPAALRFISFEPLLGPINCADGPLDPNSAMGTWSDLTGIDWAIIGGESGPGARPCHVQWIRDILRQCRESGLPVFVKQIGSQPRGYCRNSLEGDDPEYQLDPDFCDIDAGAEGPRCKGRCYFLRDHKGGNPSEWPEDLRVREWPG